MQRHVLEYVFNPRRVAVLGASENPESVGGRVFRNLVEGGFSGEVWPVNPKYQTVLGRPCVDALSDIEGDPDLAVIATPARTVVEIIRQCGEQGIGAAIILSAGFGETGEAGQRLERDLADAARHANVRFVGPNCLGVMRPGSQFNATFLGAAAPAGRLALVSQSGALCSAITDWARPHRLGFSTIASLGNATNVDFGDVLDYLAGDPHSDAILLYMEGVRDARAFISGLRVAARAKPVIVLKAGRQEGGSRAASTHTGALVGSDDVFDSVLERVGVVRAMTFGQLFAAATTLSTVKRARGNRLAIVTNGGGAGVLATDRAGDLSVALADLEAKTIEGFDALLPAHWSHGNPVDILGDATAETYGKAVELCLDDANVDGVLVMLTPQAMTGADAAAEAVVKAAGKRKTKPVLACFMGEESVAQARTFLLDNGIASFTTPERAVEAFSYLAKHRRNQELLLQTPGPVASERREPDPRGAQMIIEAALADGRSMLSDLESKAVLGAFGITCNQTIAVEDSAEAMVAAESLGFPVALKISSPDISHKSDVDGVRTHITNGVEVLVAFEQIIAAARKARPDATIKGVTVERMAGSGDVRELMVGVKSDPAFGPAISFGAGGTMAEVLRDNAVAIPPLNRVLARRLIDRTRVAQLLGPFRNLAAVDRKVVEDLLIRVSDLVCQLPHIEEMDINPVFASETEVIAVDARISVRRPPVTSVPFAHMAIHPYPATLARRKVLGDGTELTIRPIRPEDADMEQAFVRALSPEARYFRFMHSVEELTPEMLVRFTQIDYSREMAMVAVVDADDGRKQIGVARYVINPDGESCEFAVVVADEWQKKGIGSALMQGLMDSAQYHRLNSIEGAVLADNRDMLALMESLDFSVRPDPQDAKIRLVEKWL